VQADLSTLLVSAAVSVLVSTIVSLLIAPTLVVRQERAKRRERAREAVDGVAGALLLDLDRYRGGWGGPPHRKTDVADGDDTERAAKVIRAAADLGRQRRWLVQRRCRIIFGQRWTQWAMAYPGEDESNHRAAKTMFGQVREHGKDVDITSHLIHQAYSHPPDHPSQKRLARHLRWLARSL